MATLQGDPIENLSLKDVGGSALEFATGLEAPIDKAVQDYVMTARAQEKPLDIYSKLETEAGLPTLRKTASTLQGQVADIEDAIRAVKKNVAARSTQSIVTEAQRSGMESAEKAPLQENLSYLSTGLGRVTSAIQAGESTIATKTGLAMQGQDRELDTYKFQISNLADRAARMMTGFTTDQKNELDILMAKIARQQSLTDQETARAFELSKLEKQFNMEKQAAEDKFTREPPTQTVSLGNNKTALINSITGQVIKTYGSSGSGSTSAASSYLPKKSTNTYLDYSRYIS